MFPVRAKLGLKGKLMPVSVVPVNCQGPVENDSKPPFPTRSVAPNVTRPNKHPIATRKSPIRLIKFPLFVNLSEFGKHAEVFQRGCVTLDFPAPGDLFQ